MTEKHVWAGLTPRDIARLLRDFDRPWWVAGGWAIDLVLGRETRAHEDMDVALLRGDETALHRVLPAWEFHAVHDGAFERWDGSAPLAAPRHQFWVRRDGAGPWDFEVLLEHHRDGRWQFRRDRRVALPLERFGAMSPDGVPHVALEVALLYKARHLELAKRSADFDTALPALHGDGRAWLADAIAFTSPAHPWLSRLS
jgi:hypothetical protein